MQYQLGTSDCGVFAIAAAVDLAHGIDPSMITYKQQLMGQHLINCFDEQVMRIFTRFG
jgi:hypothetical protein